MIQFRWGELQLSLLDAGTLWLDGGAMFGIVPRPLWEKEREPDAQNRICLAMNLLLIEDGKQRTLVDTGAGSKWTEKLRTIYRLSSRSPEEFLAPVGLAPEAIDRVINSHLHFDHAGGNTRHDGAGRLCAAFPRAEYVVQRGELDTGSHLNERTRASYVAADFEPLRKEGRLRLVEGDVSLDRHVHLRRAPGHTPHMQIVLVVTSQGTVAFLADLVPTASHVRYPYIMAYDLEPLATLAGKKTILPQAAAERWWLVFEHDQRLPLGQLFEQDGRLVARAVQPEA